MVEHPKIPYSRVKRDGRRYLEPTPKMKALGFDARALGRDGPDARNEAWRLYEAIRKARATGTTSHVKPFIRPAPSDLQWQRFRRTDAWKAKAATTRTKDWDWSWQFIKPVSATSTLALCRSRI